MQIHAAKLISVKSFLFLSEPYRTQVALNFHALFLSGMGNNKTDSYAIQSTFFYVKEECHRNVNF